jgi:hypothetical protein
MRPFLQGLVFTLFLSPFAGCGGEDGLADAERGEQAGGSSGAGEAGTGSGGKSTGGSSGASGASGGTSGGSGGKASGGFPGAGAGKGGSTTSGGAGGTNAGSGGAAASGGQGGASGAMPGGSTGTSGATGSAGTSGASGSAGTSGASGSAGTAGTTGGTAGTGGSGGGLAAGKGAALSPYLVGQNLWYPDSVASVWPLVKASSVTLVRIGGNGPNKTVPSGAQYLEWVTQIRAIGAEPIVQVSQLVSAQEAGALVTFLNVSKGANVRFWSIGNEPDLDGVPVAEVGDYVRALASAMRAADPDIKIFAPDLAWYDEPYIGPLIGGSDDITGKDASGRYYIDGVTFHTYPNGATFDRAKAIASADGIRANVVKLRDVLDAADTKNGRTGGAKLQWGIGEFNITYANPAANDVGDHAVTSFLNGQFFAEVYGIGMEHGARFVATWSIHEGSGARGAGDLGYLDGPLASAKPRSSYWHMQLVATYFHGSYATASTNQALVKAYGAGDGNDLAVMILNEEETKAYPFTLALRVEGPPVAEPLDIRVDVGLASTISGEIAPQSSAVLLFDGNGQLTKRVDYGIEEALAWSPPH